MVLLAVVGDAVMGVTGSRGSEIWIVQLEVNFQCRDDATKALRIAAAVSGLNM